MIEPWMIVQQKLRNVKDYGELAQAGLLLNCCSIRTLLDSAMSNRVGEGQLRPNWRTR